MTHVSSWLWRLEWLERTIWLWNLNVRRHVRVWTRQRRCFYTIRRQRVLELLSMLPFDSVLVLSCLVSNLLLPFEVGSIGWGKSILHSLDGLFKQVFFFFFLLLEFQSFTLEHRELWDCGKHLSRKLGGSSFVFIDLLSNFESTLSSIKSLGSKLFSQVANLFINELFLKKRLFLVVKSLL